VLFVGRRRWIVLVGNLGGIRCGTQAALCSGLFGQGRTILLTPQPDADGVFAGWGGACEGQPVDPARCELTVGANEQVTGRATAWFRHRVAALGPQPLTVDAYSGRDLVSSPKGIACGDVCSASFASATTVTLAGNRTSWSGDCVGTVDRCTVVVDAPVDIVARFFVSVLDDSFGYGIGVSVSGRGRVTVGSKISCGGGRASRRRCDNEFAPNSTFTLPARPSRRNRFVGWADPFCRKKGRRKPRCTLRAIDDLSIEAVFSNR
jgi:List-Bact-rpt repeat protein